MHNHSDINDTVDYIDISFKLADINMNTLYEKVVEKMKVSSSLIYDLNSLSNYDANDFATIHTDIIEKNYIGDFHHMIIEIGKDMMIKI